MSPGLFDGFEGYRSADEATRSEAIRTWMVVLDTNVLLALYNYQGQALAEFTDVFRVIGDRLFVPHQALDEFWRNRLTVLRENQGKHRERAQVETALADARSAFVKWHQRVVDRVAPPDQNALDELEEAREALLSLMSEGQASADVTGPDTPTHEDQVLAKLEPILEGRVGAPPTAAEREALTREGRKRIEAKVPPGYMDAAKDPDRAVGDFIVWHQAVAEATRRDVPMLLVTNDQKEDWWADRGTGAMRARPELASELMAANGKRLLMMRSRDLVEHADLLGVQVSRSTLNEADLASGGDSDWTLELALDYLYYLASWEEHFEVFCEAVDHGGEIERTRMATLLGKDPEVGMKGSGRPFRTAARRVAEYHALDTDLTVPLAADYGTGTWMIRFTTPPELQDLFSMALTSLREEDPAADVEQA